MTQVPYIEKGPLVFIHGSYLLTAANKILLIALFLFADQLKSTQEVYNVDLFALKTKSFRSPPISTKIRSWAEYPLLIAERFVLIRE